MVRIKSLPDDGKRLNLLWFKVLLQEGLPIKFAKNKGKIDVFVLPELERDIRDLTSTVENFHPDYSILALAYLGICDPLERIIDGEVENPYVWALVPLSFYNFKWKFDGNLLRRAYALATIRDPSIMSEHHQERASQLEAIPLKEEEIYDEVKAIYIQVTRDFDSLPPLLQQRLQGNALVLVQKKHTSS